MDSLTRPQKSTRRRAILWPLLAVAAIAAACSSSTQVVADGEGGAGGKVSSGSGGDQAPRPQWAERGDRCEEHTYFDEDLPGGRKPNKEFKEAQKKACCAEPGCETFTLGRCLAADRICYLETCEGEVDFEKPCPTGFSCEWLGNMFTGVGTACGVLQEDDSCVGLDLHYCVPTPQP